MNEKKRSTWRERLHSAYIGLSSDLSGADGRSSTDGRCTAMTLAMTRTASNTTPTGPEAASPIPRDDYRGGMFDTDAA